MTKESLGARCPLKSRSHPPETMAGDSASFFDDFISNRQLHGPKVLQKDFPTLQSCGDISLPFQKSYKGIKERKITYVF